VTVWQSRSFTYQRGIQWLTDAQYTHALRDDGLSILCWRAAPDSKVEHVLCLLGGEFAFDGLAGLDRADIRREVYRSLSRSNVDNREIGIHRDIVL
jgi:hypothetical protein